MATKPKGSKAIEVEQLRVKSRYQQRKAQACTKTLVLEVLVSEEVTLWVVLGWLRVGDGSPCETAKEWLPGRAEAAQRNIGTHCLVVE